MKVAIIDYGVGNINNLTRCIKQAANISQASIESNKNSIKSLQIDLIDSKDKLKNYDKVILPGVGAFSFAMESLENKGFIPALQDFVKSGRYILGICLGMQVLFEKSYEFGEHKGLGFLKGEIIKFSDQGLKIPHMGWNKNIKLKDTKLLDEQECFLYYVHSYFAKCEDDLIVAECNYGISFPSIVNKDNIFGIQPHPERSHNAGLKILSNFLNL